MLEYLATMETADAVSYTHLDVYKRQIFNQNRRKASRFPAATWEQEAHTMKQYKVGIIGGTGMVGQRFITLMEHHPWFQLTAIAASAQMCIRDSSWPLKLSCTRSPGCRSSRAQGWATGPTEGACLVMKFQK